MAKNEYRRQANETTRDARNRYVRDWYKRNPEKNHARHWRYWLKSQYGLTVDAYNALIKRQNGQCKICGGKLAIGTALQPDSPVVDHKGSVVRGILCNHCNQALGLFKDSAHILCKALAYLKFSEMLE